MRAQCVDEGGGGVGSHEWRGGVIGFVHEVKLARNLMCQPDSR